MGGDPGTYTSVYQPMLPNVPSELESYRDTTRKWISDMMYAPAEGVSQYPQPLGTSPPSQLMAAQQRMNQLLGVQGVSNFDPYGGGRNQPRSGAGANPYATGYGFGEGGGRNMPRTTYGIDPYSGGANQPRTGPYTGPTYGIDPYSGGANQPRTAPFQPVTPGTSMNEYAPGYGAQGGALAQGLAGAFSGGGAATGKSGVPGGAAPYTDWPGGIDPSLFQGVSFFRNPQWLASVPGYEEGAGILWNPTTGFTTRDEIMALLRTASATGKPITPATLASLPSRPGNDPYKYWGAFQGGGAQQPRAGVASPYTCEQCGLTFETDSALLSHIQAIHGGVTPGSGPQYGPGNPSVPGPGNYPAQEYPYDPRTTPYPQVSLSENVPLPGLYNPIQHTLTNYMNNQGYAVNTDPAYRAALARNRQTYNTSLRNTQADVNQLMRSVSQEFVGGPYEESRMGSGFANAISQATSKRGLEFQQDEAMRQAAMSDAEMTRKLTALEAGRGRVLQAAGQAAPVAAEIGAIPERRVRTAFDTGLAMWGAQTANQGPEYQEWLRQITQGTQNQQTAQQRLQLALQYALGYPFGAQAPTVTQNEGFLTGLLGAFGGK